MDATQLEQLRHRAEAGHPESLLQLGKIMWSGRYFMVVGFISQNKEEALANIRKAADHGYEAAGNWLDTHNTFMRQVADLWPSEILDEKPLEPQISEDALSDALAESVDWPKRPKEAYDQAMSIWSSEYDANSFQVRASTVRATDLLKYASEGGHNRAQKFFLRYSKALNRQRRGNDLNFPIWQGTRADHDELCRTAIGGDAEALCKLGEIFWTGRAF